MKNAIAKINRSSRLSTGARKIGLALAGIILSLSCIFLISKTNGPAAWQVWAPDSVDTKLTSPQPVPQQDSIRVEWEVIQQFNKYMDSLKAGH